MPNSMIPTALAVLVFALLPLNIAAQDRAWPQEIEAPEGTLIMYQPQPESLKGNQLTGRAGPCRGRGNRANGADCYRRTPRLTVAVRR